jgi:hypothetical protein
MFVEKIINKTSKKNKVRIKLLDFIIGIRNDKRITIMGLLNFSKCSKVK